MAYYYRTPLGRLVQSELELHAHYVLKALYDSHYALFGDPDIPMSLRLLSEAVGLSHRLTRDACDLFISRGLVRKSEVPGDFYFITPEGIVYVEQSGLRPG